MRPLTDPEKATEVASNLSKTIDPIFKLAGSVIQGLGSNPITGLAIMAFLSELGYENLKILPHNLALITGSPSAILKQLQDIQNDLGLVKPSLRESLESSPEQFIVLVRRQTEIQKQQFELKQQLGRTFGRQERQNIEKEIDSLQKEFSANSILIGIWKKQFSKAKFDELVAKLQGEQT